MAGELYDLNRLADAIAAYEAALAGFEIFGDVVGQARVHGGLGRLHHGRYDFTAALRHFDAALHLWPSESEDAEFASLLVESASAKYRSAEFASGEALVERGLALAKRLGDRGLVARALQVIGAVGLRADPCPRIAIALHDESEALARQANDWRALSRAYLGRAVYHWLAGELQQALVDRRRAAEAAERSGETERVAFAQTIVAFTCYQLGEWDAGRGAVRASLALDPEKQLRTLPGVALLAWLEGRAEEGIGSLRSFLNDALRRGDRQGVSVFMFVLAEWELELDRPSEAEPAARQDAELLRMGGAWQPWPGLAFGPLAEVAVRLGSPEAEDVLAEGEQQVAASEQYLARPQLFRARGLLWERSAEFDRALDALQASAEVARSQHSVIQLGRTLAVLARVARLRGDSPLAANAEAELASIVQRIGPEVRVLPWAGAPRGLPRRSSTALQGC